MVEFEPGDFRPPAADLSDRVVALRAMIEAKGNALPTPPICHGKANGCMCPICAPGLYRRKERAA